MEKQKKKKARKYSNMMPSCFLLFWAEWLRAINIASIYLSICFLTMNAIYSQYFSYTRHNSIKLFVNYGRQKFSNTTTKTLLSLIGLFLEKQHSYAVKWRKKKKKSYIYQMVAFYYHGIVPWSWVWSKAKYLKVGISH